MGTSGAPWPPAATSRGRKPLTTLTPNRSAITAGSPSCQVTVGGSCHTVCPGNAMNPRSEAGGLAWARRICTAPAARPPPPAHAPPPPPPPPPAHADPTPPHPRGPPLATGIQSGAQLGAFG